MTTNYYRGRAREYQVINRLRAQGWVCTRSAMSHGPVDIVAARSGLVKLIQVKSGSARVKKSELALLKKWAVAFNADAEVWSFKKKGRSKPVKVLVRGHVAAQVPKKTETKKHKVPELLRFERPIELLQEIKPKQVDGVAPQPALTVAVAASSTGAPISSGASPSLRTALVS